MNKLLKLKNENGKQILFYHYKRIQDIDDVILQLLNEADVEGFVRCSLDKAAGDVNYDVTGYITLADIGSVHISIGVLRTLLNNLYRLLAYLEDSFIDIEYVMFEEDCVLLDPETKKLYLIVLPCQEAMDSDVVLADCLEKIVGSFTYDQGLDSEYAGKVRAKIKKGIRSLTDLQDIIDMLRDVPAMMPEELFDDWTVYGGQNEKEAVNVLFSDDYDQIQEALPSYDPVEKDLPKEEREETFEESSDAILPEEDAEIHEEAVAEVSDEIRNDLMTEVREKIRQEVEAEVREKIRQEVEAEVRAELRKEVEAEIRAEVIDEVRSELRAEMMEVDASELVSDIQKGRMPYLIRRKTGEVIQLNKQTFIIGKMDTCCDYVISNNNAISRFHAVIKYRETSDDYFIVDCNSTNHVYLNGRQIPAEQPVTLENGMHIHLALEEFIFQIRG